MVTLFSFQKDGHCPYNAVFCPEYGAHMVILSTFSISYLKEAGRATTENFPNQQLHNKVTKRSLPLRCIACM